MATGHSRAVEQVSLNDKYALDATRAYMMVSGAGAPAMLQHQRDAQRGLNTAAFISVTAALPWAGWTRPCGKPNPFYNSTMSISSRA